MNSLINSIKARFFNTGSAKDGCELSNLKTDKSKRAQAPAAKGLDAPEPRVQHLASAKSCTSFFDRISFSLPRFLRISSSAKPGSGVVVHGYAVSKSLDDVVKNSNEKKRSKQFQH